MRTLPSLFLTVLLLGSADAQLCSNDSAGLVPLSDLGPGDYLGVQGGLYPGGVNMRPAAHDAAGVDIAGQIVPLDAAGADGGGKIVVVALGHSITLGIADTLAELVEADPDRNPAVQFVQAAGTAGNAPGMADPSSDYWNLVVPSKLAGAGVTHEQVQIAWVHTNYADSPIDPWPQHADELAGYYRNIAKTVKRKLPNVQLVYLTARTYGGYVPSFIEEPEPYTYESAFGVKWILEDQIAGDADLNYDLGAGPVKAPWMAWGPYFWADGVKPRSDGLKWNCSDYQFDGYHLSPSGAAKAGGMMLDFFHSDATAKAWYLAAPPAPCAGQAIVQPYGEDPATTTPRLAVSTLPVIPTPGTLALHAYDAPPSSPGYFLVGWAPLSVGDFNVFGHGWLLVDLTGMLILPTVTDADGRAWLDLGTVDSSQPCGLTRYVQFVSNEGFGVYGLSPGIQIQAGH